MKMKITRLSLLAASLVVLSCATNVFTGERTLKPVANDQVFPAAFAQYNQVLEESKVVTGTAESRMITNVGQNIKNASQKWLNALGHPEYLNGYEWEYSLINDDQVNAWAMPGGKIAFYTGILPITQTETGVAVVMGHEVAHALANHGGQRMRAGQLQALGQVGLAVGGVVSGASQETQQILNQAYGLGSTTLGILPFSRAHENEADKIGLILTAIAGYNPDEGAELWKRMAARGGQAPPEFLSTHPSNQTRIANLERLAPIAKAEAKKYGVTSFK
ncbi:M48 family metallopeptidase [Nonlabens marinus]|uniref:Zn-dependent protease with chaperone function PA4632 n=1 Tax=Nonlabens marinus S1-08 TaxID=1454201 RepID=W8VSP8_9FLAO|nr:zn-dependent protease with chaperone function PA4632 [Nonlabens marinus S1-08]